MFFYKGGFLMSYMFSVMLLAGILTILVRFGGDAVTASMLAGAGEAVTLCLELCGAYLLFMGIIGVAGRAGLMESLSKRLKPVTRWLFPHAGKAAGPITLCLAANMLGMGNAATPFGLEAMRALDAVNPHRGIATDEMCILIAVNGSCLQLLPTGLLAMRQAAGSVEPASIIVPSLIASAASTAVAVLLCRRCMQRPAAMRRVVGVRS